MSPTENATRQTNNFAPAKMGALKKKAFPLGKICALSVTLLILSGVPMPAQTHPGNVPGVRPDIGVQKPVAQPPLTIRRGTILTVRINEPLSSDHSKAGDVFSGTLMQPVVVYGIVVAQRGQTVTGRVVEAKKAGMVSGVSQLGITLTSLNLVDGQDLPIQSQMVLRRGPTSVGRDAAALASTTALGAAIGGAAGGGSGAAIGAGAGAVTGTIGVLLTRGYPTVL
ncbi:MAG TPA: hypothetical protein VK473_07970, partial [Terriglobales bacterium]|nr:hypothetical protein [Terriglobales bacterium]